ncbi:hypothetical protein [Leucobacter sp. wl10]|uniref:hypothetical protein n=1 Tax=Leucobacter sp. wl10 TaxID=2304677 RepID=UPI000E5B7CE2|nr:hypothetical protein [Leucobacter sp. wl10]RGE21969.1 hypothetical protein D1J51_05645 [Leucobacter sp. wl10]
MVDTSQQIAAVTRALRTEDVEGEPAHVQTLVQRYPAAIDDVWDAATSAAHIAAGADPETAARAADATYGFYTGQ